MWKELFKIKSRAKTVKGIKRAIEKETDWRLELEEVEEMIRDSLIETKGNHIIVWADMMS